MIGQGSSAEEATQLVQNLAPDILLLDVDIPGGGMVMLSSIITTIAANTKVIILTAAADEEFLMSTLRAGARGYVLKGVSTRGLVSIIRGVYTGKGYVPPELAASLITEQLHAAPPAAPSTHLLSLLTEREQQILNLVAEGSSNKEIGQTLSLTEKTVKYYMTNIMQKIQVRNRVEAAMYIREIRHSTQKMSS